jgi:hypothetical protein
MTKRIADAVALCECESQDCAAELPIKKRLKLLQDDYDAKLSATNTSTIPPLIKLLPEVACVLAEISDDEDDGASVNTNDVDRSSAASANDMPRVTQLRPLPTKLMPLPAPARFLPSSQRRIITKYNYCIAGKPLACPSRLLHTSQVPLKEIDSTLL